MLIVVPLGIVARARVVQEEARVVKVSVMGVLWMGVLAVLAVIQLLLFVASASEQ